MYEALLVSHTSINTFTYHHHTHRWFLSTCNYFLFAKLFYNVGYEYAYTDTQRGWIDRALSYHQFLSLIHI